MPNVSKLWFKCVRFYYNYHSNACSSVLITCFEIFFFSFSNDLLEIARLVLDQSNPFWNCSNMQVTNQTVQGRRNNFQDNSSNSQERDI